MLVKDRYYDYVKKLIANLQNELPDYYVMLSGSAALLEHGINLKRLLNSEITDVDLTIVPKGLRGFGYASNEKVLYEIENVLGPIVRRIVPTETSTLGTCYTALHKVDMSKILPTHDAEKHIIIDVFVDDKRYLTEDNVTVVDGITLAPFMDIMKAKLYYAHNTAPESPTHQKHRMDIESFVYPIPALVNKSLLTAFLSYGEAISKIENNYSSVENEKVTISTTAPMPFEAPSLSNDLSGSDFDVDVVREYAGTPISEAFTGINTLAAECFNTALSKGWYEQDDNGKVLKRNFGEAMMLVVTEIAEAVEDARKREHRELSPAEKDAIISDLESGDTKLFEMHKDALNFELADAIIRILDYAGSERIDLGFAIKAKMLYNKTRPIKHGGKKF